MMFEELRKYAVPEAVDLTKCAAPSLAPVAGSAGQRSAQAASRRMRRRDLQDRLLRLKAKRETLKGSRAKVSAEIGRDLERCSQLRENAVGPPRRDRML
jgi:hypothetical protein